MGKNRRIKKVLAFVLILSVMFSGHMGNLMAKAQTEKTFTGEEYEIQMIESSSWEGGYIGQVTVQNTGSKKISDWVVKMTVDKGVVEDVWNAEQYRKKGGYLFYDSGTRNGIAAGESITFGYRMTKGSLSDIRNMTLEQAKLVQKQSGYRVSYQMTNQWGNNAAIEVTVQNESEEDIQSWQLVFTLNGEITNIWNADILEQTKSGYRVQHAGYNSRIPAGESVTFGMQVAYESRESISCPRDEVLSCAEGIVDKAEIVVEETTTEKTTGTQETEETTAGSSVTAENPEESIDTDWNHTMLHMDSDTVQAAKQPSEGRVKVCLLDSGVDYSEEINVVARANFLPDYEESSILFDDVSGHGTAAASLLAANPKKQEGTEETADSPEEDSIPESRLLPKEEIDMSYAYETDAAVIKPVLDKETKAQLLAEGEPWQEVEDTEEETEEDTEEEIDEEELGELDGEDSEEDFDFSQLLDNNGKSVSGMNPNVDIYSARVLDEENEAPVSRIVEGIQWAMEMEVNIIEIGFGIDRDSQELYEAIQKAHARGILMIAPAGNGENIQYPAKYPEVIAVGSLTSEGKRAEGSAKGEELELMAPGEQVAAMGAFGVLLPCSGTSMAVPQIVGIASLLWQKDLSKPAEFIRQLLDTTARSLGERELYGYGLADCSYALESYDAFARVYSEKKEKEENLEQAQETIENNTQPVATVKEDVVKGCWETDDHRAFIKNGRAYAKILQDGSVWPDLKESGLKGMGEHPGFHGYYLLEKGNNTKTSIDYVEAYIYLTKQAAHYARTGKVMSKYKAAGSVGIGRMHSEFKAAIKKKFKTYNKKQDMEGKTKKEKQAAEKKRRQKGALFIYGMALHTLGDTFSHSTYGCNTYNYGRNESQQVTITQSTTWSHILHGYEEDSSASKNSYLSNRADDVKYHKRRYMQAKNVVKQALKHCSYKNLIKKNPVVGSIGDYTAMKPYLTVAQANVVPAKRTTYLDTQFTLAYFEKYLLDNGTANAQINTLIAQYDNDKVGAITQNWVTGYQNLGEVQFSDNITKYQIYDMTVLDASGNPTEVALTQKDGYLCLPLTQGHTYTLVAKSSGNTSQVFGQNTNSSMGANLQNSGVLRAQAVSMKQLTKTGSLIRRAAAGTEESVGTFYKTFQIARAEQSEYKKSKKQQVMCLSAEINFEKQDMVNMALKGTVVKADGSADHVGKNLAGVEVLLIKWHKDFPVQEEEDWEIVARTKTDNKGQYQLKVPLSGTYRLILRKDDYIDYWQTVLLKAGRDMQQIRTARMVALKEAGRCNVSGVIRDAVTNEGVAGLKLSVRAGINDTKGKVRYQAETDENGAYSFAGIVAGNLEIEVRDESGTYAATFVEVLAMSSMDIKNQDGAVSPKMKEGGIRSVLTWGNTPEDLDTYVSMKKTQTHSIEAYAGSKRLFLDSILMDELHADGSVTGEEENYPIETHTTYRDDIDFNYQIADVSMPYSETAMSRSLAKVEIYRGNEETATEVFFVPNGKGSWWHVFRYNGKSRTIKQLQTMDNRKGYIVE